MADKEPAERGGLQKKAEQYQHEADEKRHEAAQDSRVEKIVASVEKIVQQIDRYTDAKTPENKSKRRWERWEVIGLWAAAAVGIAAIWIGSHDAAEQRKVMQRQLDDAEIQQAASVTVEGFLVTGFPNDVVVKYQIANHGPTRADQLMIGITTSILRPEDRLRVLDNPIGVSFPAPAVDGISMASNGPPLSVTVRFGRYPNYHMDVAKDVLAKMPSIGDIEAGNAFPYFALVGAYVDVFGKQHHLTDCVIYHGSFGFEPCLGQHRKYD